MTDRQLLEQILEKIGNLEQGQKNLEHRQETIEHGIGALSATLQQISAQIGASQEDTIDALKDLILPPLKSHEERITTLEEEVGIKPRKH